MNTKQVMVPYVTGYSLRQAKNRIVSAGLEISNIRYRKDIATQNVLAQIYKGKEIEEGDNLMINLGDALELVVGLSDSIATTSVPDMTMLSIQEAKNLVWENGLNVAKVQFAD